MYKKAILFVLAIFLAVSPVLAQTNGEETAGEVEKNREFVDAKIKANEFVQVGKKAIFDASDSFLLATGTPSYLWDFGDGSKSYGKDVVHQYTKTGKYLVTLTITQYGKQGLAIKNIFAYDKKALLITDETTEENLSQIKLQAAENGVALRLLSAVKEEGEFLSEDNLVKEITKISDDVKDADLLIFYTKSALGLQAFTRFWQNNQQDDKDNIKNKFFVYITDGRMDVASNFTYQSFKIIQPKYILMTRAEAFSALFTLKDYTQATKVLKGRGIEYKIIDDRGKKSPVFVLSSLITHFISKGVSSSSVYLILLIPFLACLVIFFRQIIGLSTFGIYAPVITAASFYILGIKFGLITFCFAVVTGYLVKFILSRFEILYLSKVALNLAIISLSFLAVIWLMLLFGTSVSLTIAVFPMLVMSSIAEKFMAAQSEEGFMGAVFGVLETLVVVIVSYYLIIWTDFSNIVLSWPELVLLPLLLILLIGKFTGLRLSEYLRFRSLFSEHTEE